MEFSSRCLLKCRDSVSYFGDLSPIVETLSADVEMLSPIRERLSLILERLSLQFWETPRGEFHLLPPIWEILSLQFCRHLEENSTL